jgi:parallel beta-helix repeat protein
VAVRLRLYTARARLVLLAAALATAVAGFMAFGGSSADAAKVGCGAKITKDTTLHKDLVNCPNNGILIGADGITLDLNGHLIDGDGTPASGCNPRKEFCDVGVGDEGHDRVTVMHGSVREFGIGAVASRASHARLLDLSASNNGGAGLGFDHVAGGLVKHSSGSGNGFVGWFLVTGSDHARVLHNSFRHNGEHGILVDHSSHSLIQANVIARNREEGLLMEGGHGFRVQGNRVRRNGGGITLGPGSGNVIAGNRVLRGRDGIRIEKGHGNRVAHNVVVRTRNGIRLGIRHPFLGGGRNVVRRNLVRDSRADGFLVNKKDGHSLLKHNVAKHSGDDGFDIRSRTAKLTGNRALRNNDLGIKAVRGVIDGGGNEASGNGDPRQCTNIVCN